MFDSISALCAAYRVRGFFSHNNLIGLRNKGVILWFRWYAGQGYLRVGSTNTPEGAEWRRL